VGRALHRRGRPSPALPRVAMGQQTRAPGARYPAESSPRCPPEWNLDREQGRPATRTPHSGPSRLNCSRSGRSSAIWTPEGTERSPSVQSGGPDVAGYAHPNDPARAVGFRAEFWPLVQPSLSAAGGKRTNSEKRTFDEGLWAAAHLDGLKPTAPSPRSGAGIPGAAALAQTSVMMCR
jgi:hypothetical protein